MKNRSHYILSFAATAFGLLTIKTGATFLFTEAGQVAAGDYVPFVLWFNFIAGFFYVSCGIGIFLKKPWSNTMAKVIATSTFVVLLAFAGHVLLGNAYEVRTIGAIIFRTTFWTLMSVALEKLVFKKNL